MRSTPDSARTPTLSPAQIQTRRTNPRQARSDRAVSTTRALCARLLPAAVLSLALGLAHALAVPAAAQPAGMTKAQAEEAIRAWVTGDPLQEALERAGVYALRVVFRGHESPVVDRQTVRQRLQAAKAIRNENDIALAERALSLFDKPSSPADPYEYVWHNSLQYRYGPAFDDLRGEGIVMALDNRTGWMASNFGKVNTIQIIEQGKPLPPGVAVFSFSNTARQQFLNLVGLLSITNSIEHDSCRVSVDDNAWSAEILSNVNNQRVVYTGTWIKNEHIVIQSRYSAPIDTAQASEEYYFENYEYDDRLGLYIAKTATEYKSSMFKSTINIEQIDHLDAAECNTATDVPELSQFASVKDYRLTDPSQWQPENVERAIVWSAAPGDGAEGLGHAFRAATGPEIDRLTGKRRAWVLPAVITAVALFVVSLIVVYRKRVAS